MNPAGTDAGADRRIDPKLAKALSHPLRQRILEQLSSSGEASPKELAQLLDASLPVVAYHVHVLLELGCVELARTRRVRGALAHYYRAVTEPWFDLEQRASLTALLRRQASAQTLRQIVADASDAGLAGGFDHPEALVTRLTLQLDEQGSHEVAALLEQTFTSLQQIHAASDRRAAEARTRRQPVNAEVAMLHFRGGDEEPT